MKAVPRCWLFSLGTRSEHSRQIVASNVERLGVNIFGFRVEKASVNE